MQLRLPVDPLIDEVHCTAISKALKDFCTDWERRVATPTLWKQLPTSKGLYMFVWRPKLEFRFAEDPTRQISPPYILYIGQVGALKGGRSSDNTLRKRYKGEYANYVGANPEALWSTQTPGDRKTKLQRFLTLEPLEFWYCCMSDETQILRLESRLNYLLSPPLGTVGRARLVEMNAFTLPQPKENRG